MNQLPESSNTSKESKQVQISLASLRELAKDEAIEGRVTCQRRS